MAVREVAFELECFEWADERLEVAGRWRGVAGRRLNRPVLTVETGGGRRKHLAALPGGQYGGAEETWRAAFAWTSDPAEITAAELEVGGNVVVDLPLPDRRRRRRKRAAADAGDEVVRAENTALRAQVERLRAELAGRERENMQLQAQLEQGAELEAIADAGDATVEIERLTGERDELQRLAGERDRAQAELSAEIQRLQTERDQMRVELERVRDEHDHARSDVDDLREAFAEAAAEAEEVRDRHRAELEALQDELRAERAAVARLTAQLAAGPELPPPTTPSARAAAGPVERVAPTASDVDASRSTDDRTASAAAASPPTEDSTESDAAGRAGEAAGATGSEAAGRAGEGAEPSGSEAAGRAGEAVEATASDAVARAAAAASPTAPFTAAPAPAADDTADAPPPIVETASIPGVLDPPGPIRAGGRPSSQPAAEASARASRVPAWLRAGRDEGEESDRAGGASFAALKERLEGLFAPNGRAVADDEDEEATDVYDPVPGPRRTATAARARAEATVAARRRPAELWALRVLAALLVAVLLIAFLLILTSIA
jgi:predicted  nucleic acid-binding Zn-ribbon protein